MALAARQGLVAAPVTGACYLHDLAGLLKDDDAGELLDLVAAAAESAARGQPVAVFASAVGSRRGISGYCYHTVPCVLQVWFRFGDDFAGGLRELIAAGGDTDTAGAIFGGACGARVGREGIPAPWVDGLLCWPKDVAWTTGLGQALAARLAGRTEARCPPVIVPGLLLRSALLAAAVLGHGFRRLAPPY